MRFWVFDRPKVTGAWAHAETVDAKYGEAPRCPNCGKFVGMKPWLPPYRIRLVEGTKTSAPGDVINGPGFENFIASERFIAEFERANLKGIQRWERVEIEGYSDYEGDPIAHEMVDRRFRVAILHAPKTRVRLAQMHAIFKGEPDCAVCGRVRILDSYQGVVVDQASWTGDDIFSLTNLNQLIVTDRFVEFAASGEFAGVELVPAARFAPSYASRSW